MQSPWLLILNFVQFTTKHSTNRIFWLQQQNIVFVSISLIFMWNVTHFFNVNNIVKCGFSWKNMTRPSGAISIIIISPKFRLFLCYRPLGFETPDKAVIRHLFVYTFLCVYSFHSLLEHWMRNVKWTKTERSLNLLLSSSQICTFFIRQN